uniref:ATP synthase mitochondrial F1 complex assembly factor 1 n=1 Tax=Anguilla anguilla TaxID=7936 RepID=A0A0E9X694_ANGAN
MCDGGQGKMAAAVIQMSCLYRGLLAVRTSGIRPLIPGVIPCYLRTFSMRKESEELENNPFYNKYQAKINQLRRAKPQEYEARLERRVEIKKEPLGHSKQAEFIKVMEQELEKRGKNTDGTGGFTKDKSLGSILNIDMVQNMSGEEVGKLWMQYFSTKDTISAVIPGGIYEVMFSRAKSCPMFLYAVPQKEGYEFFLGQWSGQELHFTSLINVQTMGENAPSQLILYHYSDLQKGKGIVLMTAEMDPKFISVHQAQCLANQVQLFYGTQRLETFQLVETFNHKPADFKHMSVIAELEQSGIGPGVSPAQSQASKDSGHQEPCSNTEL